jgi:hypothetical protein
VTLFAVAQRDFLLCCVQKIAISIHAERPRAPPEENVFRCHGTLFCFVSGQSFAGSEEFLLLNTLSQEVHAPPAPRHIICRPPGGWATLVIRCGFSWNFSSTVITREHRGVHGAPPGDKRSPDDSASKKLSARRRRAADEGLTQLQPSDAVCAWSKPMQKVMIFTSRKRPQIQSLSREKNM